MNWIRTANREWQTDCGKYRVHAMPINGGFEYAAMYVQSERRVVGLGLYKTGTSVANAEAAKAACQRHQEQSPCN